MMFPQSSVSNEKPKPHWAPYLVFPFSAGGRDKEDLRGPLGFRTDMVEGSGTVTE